MGSGDRIGCGSGSVGPVSRQGCGQLEPGPAPASPRQMGSGADMGSRSLGWLSRGLGRTLEPLCTSGALAAMA